MESDNEDTSDRKRKPGENPFSVKRFRSNILDDDEKERLEKRVLGDASYMLRNLGVGDSDSGVEDGYRSDSPPLKPVWEDEEDQGIKVDGASYSKDTNRRKHFNELYGEPSWAKLKRDATQEADEDTAILRSAGHYLTKGPHLPRGTLAIKRLASLNSETRNEGPFVKCVEFHPKSTVALVAGLSGVASIFQVDGKCNKKLASVAFKKFRIKCAHFTADGSAFIVGSQHHPFFYVYDMMEGATIKISSHHKTEMTNMKNFQLSPDGEFIAVVSRFGFIHLLSAGSKEWIGNLQHNSNVTSIVFSPCSSYLYSHTDTGEVYVWEMKTRQAVSKFQDEGTIEGRSLAASEGYLATGSSWGVVNLYDAARVTSGGGKQLPLKAFKNLVTPVTSLKFNSSQQILAMASDVKENQIKMAHLPSMQVFSNFPSVNSNLNQIQALDFSPGSGYFACTNCRSTAFLYRLPHFSSY